MTGPRGNGERRDAQRRQPLGRHEAAADDERPRCFGPSRGDAFCPLPPSGNAVQSDAQMNARNRAHRSQDQGHSPRRLLDWFGQRPSDYSHPELRHRSTASKAVFHAVTSGAWPCRSRSRNLHIATSASRRAGASLSLAEKQSRRRSRMRSFAIVGSAACAWVKTASA